MPIIQFEENNDKTESHRLVAEKVKEKNMMLDASGFEECIEANLFWGSFNCAAQKVNVKALFLLLPEQCLLGQVNLDYRLGKGSQEGLRECLDRV